MSRIVAAVALVFGFAFTSSAIAQDVKTKTKIKGDEAQTVTYTGCVAEGPQTRTFVLNKVMPVGQTSETTTDASGASSTSTTTTYALVPSDTVQVTEYVGHKVQVTGMLVPKGEMRARTETKVGDNTVKKEETKTESDVPQFRVISIRNLAETCQ
jgi:Flp pilus assembly protein TadG